MFHVDLTPFGVDMERLKRERLERLQAAMATRGLGALLLTDPLNIRYATNAVLWLNMRATAIQRYALVPVEGEPIIYERPLGKGRAGGDPKPGGTRSFNAFMFAMRPAAATEHFASQVADGLQELGVAGEPLGVDALNLGAVESLRAAGAAATDGWPALLEARRVKTVDEVQLIQWTTQTKFRGYDLVRETLAEMPASEDRLSRLMLDYLLDQGFEAGSEFIVIYDSSQMVDRPHSEPMGTDLVVAEGDLLICDATVAGPGGYYSDFARTYSRGTPSAENRARYQEAYATLQEALPLVKPGPCTELFQRFGKDAEDRLPGLDGFHGVGMSIYETPWLRGWDPPEYEVALEENMIIALEVNHYPVKLEHLLRVTGDGAEILSTYPIEPELVVI